MIAVALLLAVPHAQSGHPPGLLNLGAVVELTNEAIFSKRPADRWELFTLISDDGKRIFMAGYNTPIYVWEVGKPGATVIGGGGVYDPINHRPLTVWDKNLPKVGMWSLSQDRTWVGLLDKTRPVVWESGQSSHGGIIFSYLGWIDISKSGPSSATTAFFIRERRRFRAFDPIRRLLVVQLWTKDPAPYEVYQLGNDYRTATKVPLPPNVRRMADWRWQRFSWNYAYARGREVNLHTGAETPLGIDPSQVVDSKYAGDELYLTLCKNKTDDGILFRWDRKAKRLFGVGPFWLIASSNNGRHIIFGRYRGSLEYGERWLVSRK